jgi:putative component of membrane protein insertase Oxa1/YidC/SpoIIIJ protein YidD
VSSLDQRYRLQKKLITSSEISAPVQAYREVLKPALYSKCSWFPTDSTYAVVAQKKCGALKGGMMAFSRFMFEYDAVKMGFPIINNHDHIESVDLVDDCWL